MKKSGKASGTLKPKGLGVFLLKKESSLIGFFVSQLIVVSA